MRTTFIRESRGFTLLEILLALFLCAIIALVSVPAMGGWWAEHKMRMKANELIELVRDAKAKAGKTGQSQVVVLLDPSQAMPEEPPANWHFLRKGPQSEWVVTHFGGKVDPRPSPEIRIDSHGYVEPVIFRITEENHYLEMQFDFLTGHVREVGYSF